MEKSLFDLVTPIKNYNLETWTCETRLAGGGGSSYPQVWWRNSPHPTTYLTPLPFCNKQKNL